MCFHAVLKRTAPCMVKSDTSPVSPPTGMFLRDGRKQWTDYQSFNHLCHIVNLFLALNVIYTKYYADLTMTVTFLLASCDEIMW